MQSTMPALPFRFTFRWRKTKLVLSLLFALVGTGIAIWLLLFTGKVGLGIFLAACSLVLILVLYLMTLFTCPILIDESSITRRVWGFDCPRIAWEQVSSIDVYLLPAAAGGGGNVRSYAIRPKPGLSRSGFLGKIIFNDESGGLQQLLLALDHFAEKFDIPVNLGAGVTRAAGNRL